MDKGTKAFGILISPFVIVFWLIWVSFLNILSILFKFVKVKDKIRIEDIERNTDFSVCGTLYNKGMLSKQDFEFERDVSRSVDNTTYIGYVYFFFPIILFLQNFDSYDRLVKYLVTKVWMKKAKTTNDISSIFSVKQVRLIGDAIIKLKTITQKFDQVGGFRILSVILTPLIAGIIVSGIYKDLGYFYPIVAIIIVLFFESISNNMDNKQGEFPRVLLLSTAVSYLISYVAIILYIVNTDLTNGEFIKILMISTPVFAGISYPISHEYLHSRSKFENRLGKLISLTVLMPMFGLVHNKGHHKDLNGKYDSVVSMYDQKILPYIFKQIFELYTKSYKLDKRLFLEYVLLQMIILLASILLGAKVFFFIVLLHVFSLTILELVNYIEHYSLGSQENIRNKSWDTKNSLTNGVLFNVGKHAHHHEDSKVVYSDLKLRSKFILPYGYISQIMMLVLPRTWNIIIKRRKNNYQN